ncbi:uncharacterized protein sS8_2121 [Methylocaldum marinum]|jgi:hypothetical protein|uniref:Uncharacterized protein n=1 Tax=Methylocaldum marinum TaxID=1432792 RepID=A0A250KQX5_9GAMM|nr:hypothetical protein [Methylocaldum marinum]BBA34073.1 uncharacterized protein sS8_2121 [Methylocaldum marinum]
MSETSSRSKAPSELLAEQIAHELVDKALVLANDAKTMQRSLAAGKLKAEDWRLLIEKAIDKGDANDKGGNTITSD